MKNAIITITLLFSLAGNVYCQTDMYGTIKPIVDYTISYSWDKLNGDWINPRKNVYVYNDLGQLEKSVSLDYVTLDSLARTIYEYNESGKLVEYLFQNYSAGTWINLRKYIIQPDEFGRTKTQIVIDWKDEELVYNRKQDYFYNESGKVSFITYSAWNGTDWYEIATEYYYYDEDGTFVRTENIGINGTLINRVLYETNSYNQRTKMVVQTWVAGDWANVYQDIYDYDACGLKSISIRQTSQNGDWINQSKTEFYWEFNLTGNRRTIYPVCHKGNTIYVPEHEINNHIAHGDCPGKCIDEQAPRPPHSRRSAEVYNPVQAVYPNPASDKITVKMKDPSCNVTRVEIADLQGVVIKVFNTDALGELTVPRGNLANGAYFVRVYSDQIYSVIVVFN